MSGDTSRFWRCAGCGKHAPARVSTCRCGTVRPDAIVLVRQSAPLVTRQPGSTLYITTLPQEDVLDTTASGRFWLCPVCRRHAPSRTDQCQCGFDRTTVNIAVPNRMATPLSRPGDSTHSAHYWPPWLVGGVGLLLAFGIASWLWDATQRNERANAELRARMTERQDQQAANAASQIVYVPQAPTGTAETPTTTARFEPIPAPGAAAQQVIRIEVPQQQARPPAAAAQAPMEFVDPMKTEGYWQQRLVQSRDRVRAAYEMCVSQWGQGGIGDVGWTTYASASASLVTAVAAQQQLEDDARKAGASPGWVRFDWSSYQTLRLASWSPQSALTHRHPCSVPDLLKEIRY